jgi:tripartite-type tricarboxylate transporter receptor subunit TctC
VKRSQPRAVLAVVLAAGCCATNAIHASAAADAYPGKPIRLIVPFAPGGGTDLIARTIGQPLTDALKQPVVVDNRAGAGGVIGADLVAKAAPDGYTLLMGTPGPLTINPNLQATIPYSLTDFVPIALATISPFILVVNPAVPAASVKELIALARARPGALNFGSAGNGSVAHLAAEQFKGLTGVQITHIPYKGGGQSLIDLLGGQLQIVFENLPVVLPHIRSGKLRALAVGTKKRSALVPEYPTMIEAGVPGYEASTASGVLAPAKTPRETVARLNRDIVKILHTPEVKERFAAQGLEAVGSTPEQYAEHLRAELAQYAKVIKAAGIRLE